MKHLTAKVAGVTYENRQAILAQLRGNEFVKIVPEPDNAYDPNALAVWVALSETPDAPDGSSVTQHVGYIPKELAKVIAPLLDGEHLICKILEVTGGFEMAWGEQANYGLLLSLDIPDETVLHDDFYVL
jgi:single-stranded-DNA-specific exonuclease